MKIEQREQGLTIVLEGELGHREALDIMRRLEDVIDSYGPGSLELDFSGISFMDSSGIAVVVQAHRQMQITGGSLVVSGVSRQAMRVFSAAGIPRLVRFLGWEGEK